MDIYIVSIISYNMWEECSQEDYYFSSRENAEKWIESHEFPNKDVVNIEIHLVSLDTNYRKMIYSQTL